MLRKKINIVTIIALIVFYFLSISTIDKASTFINNEDFFKTERKEQLIKLSSNLGFLIGAENTITNFSLFFTKKTNPDFFSIKNIFCTEITNKSFEYIRLLKNFPIKYQSIDIVFPFHCFW